MRDGSRHEEHNDRQGWSTVEDETESRVREEEGEERFSHSSSIRVLLF